MKGIIRKTGKRNSDPGGRLNRGDLQAAYSTIELNLLIAQGLGMEEMARLVVTAMPSLLGVPFAALGFLERGADWLVVGQWGKRPLEAALSQELSSLLANTLAEPVFGSTGSLWLADFPSAAVAVPEPLAKLGVRSLLVVPVRTITNTFGVMMVGREAAEDYAPHQRLLVSTVTNQMAVALENRRLYEASQREVAERKRAEEKVIEIKESYERITDNADEVIFRVEAEGGHVFYANPAAERLLGYTQADWLADSTLGFKKIHPDFAEEQRRIIREINTTKKPIKNVVLGWIAKDGREVIIEYAIIPVMDEKGEITYFESIGRDITERKQVEEMLRESEEKYRGLVRNVKLGIFRSTPGPKGEFLEVNPAMEEITGYRRKELLQMNVTDLYLHPEERAVVLGEVALGKGKAAKELHIRKKDGTEIVVLDRKVAVRDDAGQIIYFDGILEDITERRQAEEALRVSEESFRNLVENAPVGIAITSPNGPAFVRNRALQEMYGYESREELMKVSATELYYDLEDRKRYLSLREKGPVKDFETRFKRKDGTVFWVSLSSLPLIGDSEERQLGVVQDITERKQAEEREKELQRELNLSSRLASIGELAAGVAHEINNPLTGVIGFSQHLLRKSNDEETRTHLGRIHSEALRAAKIVENLSTFARRRGPKKEHADINEVLGRTLELRTYELRASNIELIVELASDIPKVTVDFQQLQQVFLNIILNAEQAMTEASRGGKLVIKTEKVKDYVRISFNNDGPEIPAEYLGKLFDPFFTTRGDSGGTGLGLSVCHGIVTEHDGKIYTRSRPGKGATFFVELPLTQSNSH